MKLKNFVFEEAMVADIILDPDAEGYIIDLKQPWDLYIENATDYDIRSLCIYMSGDFTDTSIIVEEGVEFLETEIGSDKSEMKSIAWKPTVNDMEILERMLESKLPELNVQMAALQL